MFDKLFKRRNDSTGAGSTNDESSLQLAVAALLIEAAKADEEYQDAEIAIIDKYLTSQFQLSSDDARALRRQAEQAQENALDIQRFTRVAKSLTLDEKKQLIENLWKIVLSDGTRDPFEDALIRRICGLIYLEDRESGLARARAEAALARQ